MSDDRKVGLQETESAGNPGAGADSARAARRAARKQAKLASRQKPGLSNSDFMQRRSAGVMRFVFRWAQAVGRERASRIASRIARTFGPLAGEHKVGAANLAAAYPEKSDEERARMLSGVWDQVARQMIEYAFLEEIAEAFDPAEQDGETFVIEGLEHIKALRDSGKAAIIFGAHLGNWELNAAIGARLGLPVTALFRPPNNPHVAAEMEKRRSSFIDQLVVSRRGAALQVARALNKGNHVGIIVDQRISDGQLIDFFGRPSMSNPIVGALARLFDCPVHGSYSIRLPDGRFRLLMTPPLDLPRDLNGRVDADAANVMVHGMVESWIREHPEQWLWLHDRWRAGRRKHGKQY